MRRGFPSSFAGSLLAIMSAVPTALEAQMASEGRSGPPPLSALDSATHLLNRLAFGPRPGEAQRVAKLGIQRWIDHQLKPEAIVDSSGARALKGCGVWTDPLETAVAALSGPVSVSMATRNGGTTMTRVTVVAGGFMGLITRDSAKRAMASGVNGNPFAGVSLENAQLIGCRLARVEASDQQLVEVMTDFWENHFSLFGGKVVTRGAIIEWDRGVIRPRALGKFRDLLGEVAHSPAMLSYLDNALSRVDSTRRALKDGPPPPPPSRPGVVVPRGLNENYAREVLELHTLGVDGGYTQADIIDVARAFTGWTHSLLRLDGTPVVQSSRDPGSAKFSFVFDSTWHDADPKLVLGNVLPANRGLQDGEDVLDILARHPSTARFIARKLATRFVSDEPPQALVDRAAETFRRTDGDIREVMRTIVTSPEFFAPEAYRAKVKSPIEFVISLRRAMAAPVDTAAEEVDFLIELRQPPFGKLTPDGWPETGQAWMTADAVRVRIGIAQKVAAGEVPSIPLESWPGWRRLRGEPFDRQMDGVIELLLNGRVSTATRAAMNAGRSGAGDGPADREGMLRDLVAMALSSPEFQRR
jgi:uncharacterized protein (DUF1800 family)